MLHKHPYDKNIVSQRSSELFASIREDYELYSLTRMTEWNYEQERPYKKDVVKDKRRIYLHIYFNIDKYAEDETASYKKLMSMRNIVPSVLFTDYIAIANLGTAFFNADIANIHQVELATKSAEKMAKAVQLACDLGVRIIQIAGYDEYYNPSTEQTKLRFAANLEKSVLIAAEYGVILAFETMETDFINTVEKAMNHVNLINSPYLQVYPDTGNITCAAIDYKTNVIQDLETGSGHLAAIHLKETLPGVFREVDYGKGHVDFESLIKRALDLGVRLFVAEFWHDEAKDWQQELTKNREYLLRYFRQS